ncbi:B-cell antigen receptor complex-associated protein beta chain isoform X2 [Agelaius phoeniceus]|uniref:B-cell antigen receptor complex-associated protein beta chain isoform X2 n=1 Tax=Agelaius phoeniceus TaxID=39638 RepID=UPI004054BA6E
MAALGTRLWLLLVTLWLLPLLTGGTPADKNSTGNSTDGMCPSVHQNVRYVAVKKNMPIYFVCYSQEPQAMQWYKTAENREDLSVLDQNTARKGLVQKEKLHSCGTELRVMGTSSIKQFQNRNTLKDAIIIIQSILLVIFISIPILLFLDKGEDKKSPEEDHTYEGLEVEQMATYEDITPFRDVKAKWTVGEHPGEE